MNFETYTDRAKGFLQAAQTIATREGHQRFLPDHVLKALLDDPQGLASNLIANAGGRAEQAIAEVDQSLAKLPQVSGAGAGGLQLAPETAKLFKAPKKSRRRPATPS